MDWVLALLLFAHVFGAILAFGPTYAFMILGPMTGREPMHANFALRFQKAVSSRMIAPFALLQGVTGLLLVWRIGFELLQRGWLIVAIVLYLIVLAIGFGVLIPSLRKLVAASAAASPPSGGGPGGPPPSGGPPGVVGPSGAGGPPGGGGPPAGPPPHIMAVVRRARMAGMVNGVLVLVIVFLMVTKPF